MSASSAISASASRACGTSVWRSISVGEEAVEQRPHLLARRPARRSSRRLSARPKSWLLPSAKSISCASPSHAPKWRDHVEQHLVAIGDQQRAAHRSSSRRAATSASGVASSASAQAIRSGSCASRKPSIAASTAGSPRARADRRGSRPVSAEQPIGAGRLGQRPGQRAEREGDSVVAYVSSDRIAYISGQAGFIDGRAWRGEESARCRGQRTQPEAVLRPAARARL